MAKTGEPGQATALGLISIHRKLLVGASAGMHYVVGAATDRMFRPGIHDVKNQRAVDGNVGMQAGGRLPGTITDSGDELAGIAAPRAAIAQDATVRAWLKAQAVRMQLQDAVRSFATIGTSNVGYPIVDNPESRQYIGDAVDNVILGTQSPASACATANTSLNSLITKDGS